MDIDTAHVYLTAAEYLEAQEALEKMDLSDYPFVKSSPRSKMYAKYTKKLNRLRKSDNKTVSMEDLAVLIGR